LSHCGIWGGTGTNESSMLLTTGFLEGKSIMVKNKGEKTRKKSCTGEVKLMNVKGTSTKSWKPKKSERRGYAMALA